MWAKSLSNDFQFFRTSATNDYHPYFGGWLRRATTTRKEGDDIKTKVHIIIVSYVRECKLFLGYSGDQYNTILCVEWRNSATGGIQCCWFHSPIMDRVGEQQRGKEKSPLAIRAKWIVIVGWNLEVLYHFVLCCKSSLGKERSRCIKIRSGGVAFVIGYDEDEDDWRWDEIEFESNAFCCVQSLGVVFTEQQ